MKEICVRTNPTRLEQLDPPGEACVVDAAVSGHCLGGDSKASRAGRSHAGSAGRLG